MNIKIIKRGLEKSLIVFVLYILTFPAYESVFTIGLDSSYIWALNHLFANSYESLKEMIYPLGPLSFLLNFTFEGNNFELFLCFHTLIKIWFILLFMHVVETWNHKRMYVSYLILILILIICKIDFLLIGITLFHCLLFLENKKLTNIFLAAVIGGIGICIKSSIGISAISIIIMTFIIDLYKNRNYKISCLIAGISIVTMGLIGLLVFRQMDLLLNYYFNVFRLSLNYSSALSIFPDNNWIVLILFFISFFANLLVKDKNVKRIFIILFPVFFAMWKHAMTREDFTHISILLAYLFLYWGIIISLSKTKTLVLLLLASINISLFYSNMTNTWNYYPFKVEISGINNFKNLILDVNNYKQKSIETSTQNVNTNVLDSSVLEIIHHSTIDSYPWELSYFAANNLNWKPRKTLQSGSYARWLDAINANDFNRIQGPDFLIFHFNEDNYGGKFGSIDGRYLLNDNPLTVFTVFNDYSLVLKNDQFLLLKKNKRDNFKQTKEGKIQNTTWNRWITVPYEQSEILRIKVFSKVSLIGKIKNFIYKTEEYFVDYMFEDSTVLTYRYISNNARDGIWIHPFIRFPDTKQEEKKPIKLRFRCSNHVFNKQSIQYQFQHITLDLNAEIFSTQKNVNSLFLKNEPSNDSLLLTFYENFENQKSNNQSHVKISSVYSYAGNFAHLVESDALSHIYTIQLDTFWKGLDTTVSEVWIESIFVYLNSKSKATHIIEINQSDNNIWKGNELQLTQNNHLWNYSYNIVQINRNEYKRGILKICIWNTGKHKIYMDNWRISIRSIKHSHN